MTKLETIKTLEKRYLVYINRDTFWNPLTNREIEDFKIYTLDGCCWDKVIGYRSLIHCLVSDKKSLLKIGKEYMKNHPEFEVTFDSTEEDEDDDCE